jgi:HAD superfamily hydrolase (TIGR01549 family)
MPVAVSFDLFGTLVAVDGPDDPGAAVADALAEQGVAVPDDWNLAYREAHASVEPGAEYPLTDHVRDALASRGVAAAEETVTSAVREAFDAPVRTREGARRAVAAASERGPVGILSNCSVPGLVERTLDRSALDPGAFDAVVASVDCGWRKPDPRAFQEVADELGVGVDALVHVGDDPATDGGASAVGATALVLEDAPLATLPERLGEGPC